MCVRFEAIGDAAWREDRISGKARAIGSMFPGYDGVVMVREGADYRPLDARWGLVPFWAKDPKIARQTYNARCETVAEKPSFREAFRRRRCLVPASAFFERADRHWWRVSLGSHAPLLMAGLFEEANAVSTAPTFTLITTEPNAIVGGFHDRMPVILGREVVDTWLDPATPPAALHALLRPFPDAELMVADAGPIGKATAGASEPP